MTNKQMQLLTFSFLRRRGQGSHHSKPTMIHRRNLFCVFAPLRETLCSQISLRMVKYDILYSSEIRNPYLTPENIE